MRKAILPLLFLTLSVSAQTAQEEADPGYAAWMCRVVTATDLADSGAPSFSSFPADHKAVFKPAKLDLASNPTARKYRTVLRNEMERGTNFAGHYRVAIWGCGTSCFMFAVVDLISGRVFTAPHVDAIGGDELAADDFLPEERGVDDLWALRFTNNSRLLIVVGQLDESREGAFYFALTGKALQPVHTTAVHKSCPH